MRRGEATLVPLSEPASVGSRMPFEVIGSSLVSVDQLAARGVDGSALLGKVWPRETAALSLLRAYIRCLKEIRLSNGAPLIANVSEHILDLIAMACRGSERGDSTHSAIRAGRLAAILAYI